jgi:hypothetical protein
MQFRPSDNRDVHVPHEGGSTDGQQLSTVAEIDERIAADRLRYIAAYFAGDQGEAQFWVYEIARLQNLRNIVLRQDVAS